MSPGVRRWPLTDRVLRQFEIFELVMERTRVDPVRATRMDAGNAIAQARKVCLACPFQERCRSLLAREAGPDELLATCPNAGFLARCRRPG
jgi:hypothetical protein